MTTHRATIRDGVQLAYRLGDIAAVSLPQLCHLLIEAGFDPDDSVECYRPGREAWDLRASSLRGGARLFRDRSKGSTPPA
jgi:hypothetical protein